MSVKILLRIPGLVVTEANLEGLIRAGIRARTIPEDAAPDLVIENLKSLAQEVDDWRLGLIGQRQIVIQASGVCEFQEVED
jgi:hypothetical protein